MKNISRVKILMSLCRFTFKNILRVIGTIPTSLKDLLKVGMRGAAPIGAICDAAISVRRSRLSLKNYLNLGCFVINAPLYAGHSSQ